MSWMVATMLSTTTCTYLIGRQSFPFEEFAEFRQAAHAHHDRLQQVGVHEVYLRGFPAAGRGHFVTRAGVARQCQ